MDRESFVFYKSFYNSISALPIEEQLTMYKTIAERALFGKEIVNALKAFRKEKNYNTVAIDNPAFTGLLQAVQVFGDSIPSAIIDSAVFKLKNEQGTLMAIKTLLQKNNTHGYNGGALNELLIDNTLIDSAIKEAGKYGSTVPVALGRVMQISNAIEHLDGYSMNDRQESAPETKFYI